MSTLEHYFENLLFHGSDIKGEPNKRALSKEVQDAVEQCVNYVKYTYRGAVERRTSRWNLMETHNCYEVYQCEECERKITVFHRFGDVPSVADVTVDYPYCHCGAKMEVDE